MSNNRRLNTLWCFYTTMYKRIKIDVIQVHLLYNQLYCHRKRFMVLSGSEIQAGSKWYVQHFKKYICQHVQKNLRRIHDKC